MQTTNCTVAAYVTIIAQMSLLYWHYFILLSFNCYGPPFSVLYFPTIVLFWSSFSGLHFQLTRRDEWRSRVCSTPGHR